MTIGKGTQKKLQLLVLATILVAFAIKFLYPFWTQLDILRILENVWNNQGKDIVYLAPYIAVFALFLNWIMNTYIGTKIKDSEVLTSYGVLINLFTLQIKTLKKDQKLWGKRDHSVTSSSYWIFYLFLAGVYIWVVSAGGLALRWALKLLLA